MGALEGRGRAILKRLAPNAKVAEVGVLLGKLSEYLLERRSDIDMLLIDSWAPAEEQPKQYQKTRDVHSTHTIGRVTKHKNETEARVGRFHDRAHIMHMTSLQAAAEVKNASLDLVFLDADHSYRGVRTDLALWTCKVKAGGWIGGHDYKNPEQGFDFTGVERAVKKWAKERGRKIETDENYTWFCQL